MAEAWVYAVVTAAVSAVVGTAVWRPRPGQWVLLVVGPLLAAAAAAASVSSELGTLVLLVVVYAYLIVPAALPWESARAQWAVPGTVVAGCLALAATPSASLPVRVLLAAPAAIGVLALSRAFTRARADARDVLRRQRDRRRFGYTETMPDPPVPVVERAVVAVSTLQGLAGVALIGLGMFVVVLEQRYPTTGPWAGTAYLIAAFIAGVGVVISVTFCGLAQGLHRRFDDYRALFVGAQVVVGVLFLVTSRGWWVGPGAAWAFGTAALAMVGSGPPGDSARAHSPGSPSPRPAGGSRLR